MARIEPLKLIVGEKILSGVASALRFFGRQPTDSSSVSPPILRVSVKSSLPWKNRGESIRATLGPAKRTLSITISPIRNARSEEREVTTNDVPLRDTVSLQSPHR